MNIESFRDYCLSFKGVHDKMPFGKATSEYDRNVLVFCVLNKWFCFVNIDVFDFCNLKCPPEQVEELVATYIEPLLAKHAGEQSDKGEDINV